MIAAIRALPSTRLTRPRNSAEVSAGGTGEVEMLEYLGYTVFLVVMLGCLLYVMSSLETEGAPEDPKR